MSQALSVEKRQGGTASSGSSALAVAPGRTPSSPAGSTARARTPLSLVPAPRTRRRIPFAVFTVLLLVAALTTVLMLNISVSGKQYELVELRNQQIALAQQNEALVLEVEDREAPQNLASAAGELGMVAAPSFGMIDLLTGTVSGTPVPAQEGEEPDVLVAAPKLDTERPVPAPPSAEEDDPAAPSPEGSDGTGAAVGDVGTIPGPQQLGTDR